MSVGLETVTGVSLLYVILLFLIAYYAHVKGRQGESIVSNPYIYSLSIAVYCTSWTFYGSVGKAATTGMDFILIYLGPSLTAFAWWLILRKIIRITKENNITSIADFLSSRYGKSQWLGALITVIAILGIVPYVALQLKAVSTTFQIICGEQYLRLPEQVFGPGAVLHSGFIAAVILSAFGIIFGARTLRSSERHEGLVAAIAFESIVKLVAFLIVGIFVTYVMFDGFTDIFSRLRTLPNIYDHLTTFGGEGEPNYANWFTMLFLSMSGIMFLPRQFHIMVIENSSEEHIKEAMWRFPAYLFAINIFVIPIAFGGILLTGSAKGADYFVLSLPLQSGHSWIALLAFLGGFSAAAGMVMTESVAVSTMFLNHLIMPIVVKLTPRTWFPLLLINLKRLGIFLVIFLGYAYNLMLGDTYTLVNIGLISFAATAQFVPAMLGALYWRRGNRAGAISGIFCGFLVWFYSLLLPSFIESGWWKTDILEKGPFGIALLKPTELFGLSGFDVWSHALFWSMFFNAGCYLFCSIVLKTDDAEREQGRKFVDVFRPRGEEPHWETKRLSKPVTIMQFVTLLAKFTGEQQAYAAISEYLGNREIDEKGGVSEFELPNLKRFVEKTLAGSVGAAAAGAIVESYLSDVGSKMESFYDIFSSVRTSLEESREALYVRLKASEIMNRSLDIRIIMEDLLELLIKEFKFDLAVVRTVESSGTLKVQCFKGIEADAILGNTIVPEVDTYIGEAFLTNKPQFVNDARNITKARTQSILARQNFSSFAHIPIAREGEPATGILSVFSMTIVGLFTEPFLNLLASLAGQLAQAVKIVEEREAREQERREKEKALLETARVTRDMELAKQIQLSLLPDTPPSIPGIDFASRCVPATHIGGDYYDYFARSPEIIDFVIADVSGHSVGAALIMVETRSVLRAQAMTTSSTGDIIRQLNALLYEDLSRAELFISMFYAKYDAGNKSLSYSSAGHNLPLLYRHSERSCEELDAEGMILGVKPVVEFEEKQLSMAPGDVLLLYTDGITEAENETGEMFGTERLITVLKDQAGLEAAEIVEGIYREVKLFTRAENQTDDISVVVLKMLW